MLRASAKLASIKDVTTLVSTIVATEMAVAERVNGNNKLKLPAVNANTIGVAIPAKAIASTSKSKGFQSPVLKPSSTLFFILSNFKNLSAILKVVPNLYNVIDYKYFFIGVLID